ncbi:MAG: putative preprotein translocase, subunit YajC [Rickettsiaceae bacterium]|jgi:preprotein translocase subunit YajC|nr:putative preprotein translocase, subunit YajC [Rickettsiaceae bacterium]
MTKFFSDILVSDAFAQNADAAATAANPGFTSFIPLILVFGIFYFLLVRPQQKKAKEHQNTLNNLKSGDKVQTSGGIFGTVKSIDAKENIVDLEIAPDVVIKIIKHNIVEVAGKDKAHAHSHKSKKDKK